MWLGLSAYLIHSTWGCGLRYDNKTREVPLFLEWGGVREVPLFLVWGDVREALLFTGMGGQGEGNSIIFGMGW